MYEVKVEVWDSSNACWKDIDRKDTKLKTCYKRYMNALRAVYNEVDKLNEESISGMNHEKLYVKTTSRKYTIYFA